MMFVHQFSQPPFLDCATPTPAGYACRDESYQGPAVHVAARRKTRRGRADPYALTELPADAAPPAPAIIPNDVYAPQTLPLHVPQPVACFPPVSALDTDFDHLGLSPGHGDAHECNDSPVSKDHLLSNMSNLRFSAPSLPPPINTFPTPSELLSELATHEFSSTKPTKRLRKKKEYEDIALQVLGFIPTDP